MGAVLEFDNVSFAYAASGAGGEKAASGLAAAPAPRILDGASLAVPEGAFALLTGATGSGKSTLLRLAKPELAPAGERAGQIRVLGRDASDLSPVESARAVGYVFQSPDAQIVCDTVWHEMAFGLENLGVPEPEMRRRVAETCNFFGMEPWFRAQTAELSGGQRQMLALAATLAIRPRVLLLDEPTSMLDPIAEKEFLGLLFRANRELGITVVVATHAPAPMCAYATCAFRLEAGAVREVATGPLAAPRPLAVDKGTVPLSASAAVEARELWFRHGRDCDWVLRGLDLRLVCGEVRALAGGNGCGKSTLLSLLAGVARPQKGRVKNALAASQALLPQSPKAILACQTVRDELSEWGRGAGYGDAEVDAALAELGLADAAARHPYDLSGGQQQMLALQKLLLCRPRLLLLDEPTKGLDDDARAWVARAILRARDAGATVLLTTHDMAFVEAVADRVSLMFDGQLTCTQPAAEFFADSWLYRP
ncbi:ABC transporter ATP-binding protein [Paratractidigestivibacter sp.]|uniref:ABC transporter ATP-binding protein n=1 Tax=Paratractidigestivibacter sp. TaxID=2847316 RepID=UPI002AC944DA|nr:ATP-binding cassette domain-containing protein [Paratractidigestivibacter sp.]